MLLQIYCIGVATLTTDMRLERAYSSYRTCCFGHCCEGVLHNPKAVLRLHQPPTTGLLTNPQPEWQARISVITIWLVKRTEPGLAIVLATILVPVYARQQQATKKTTAIVFLWNSLEHYVNRRGKVRESKPEARKTSITRPIPIPDLQPWMI